MTQVREWRLFNCALYVPGEFTGPLIPPGRQQIVAFVFALVYMKSEIPDS